jgi:hypothetical protein
MAIIPTWDLFILVFFVIIITYSLIIGRSQTVKVMIASYISVLTADGLGNLLQMFFLSENSFFRVIQFDNNYVSIAKVVLFAIILIILMLKGSFTADITDGESSIMSFFLTGMMGLFCAALMISTIMIFIAGGSFLIGHDLESNSQLLASIYSQSIASRVLLDNSSLWFSLPAIAFIVGSVTLEE